VIRPLTIFPIAYLNGAFLPVAEALVSPLDRGFLLGDGLFETVRIDGGALIDLGPHLDRLEGSAAFFGISLPDRAELVSVFTSVITKNELHTRGAPEAALRLTVSRGIHREGPPTVLVHARRLSGGHLSKRDVGVRLYVLPFCGRGDADMVRHKSSSHVASALAEMWLLDREGGQATDEGLFVDEGGAVREGNSSNVFAIRGDTLHTPPVEAGLLPGVSRAALCAMAEDLGYNILEAPLELLELAGADEALVTSSTLHVAPAVSLDDRPIGTGKPGPRVRAIQEAFERRVQEQIGAWHREGPEQPGL
jgi:branched-subunit amino acid aminotransferase/4-amino-4-deoxychorismate lyase